MVQYQKSRVRVRGKSKDGYEQNIYICNFNKTSISFNVINYFMNTTFFLFFLLSTLLFPQHITFFIKYEPYIYPLDIISGK